MQLYSGSSTQFIEDAVQNGIAGKLKHAFEAAYRYAPSENEVRAWHNSLSRLKDIFQRATLTDHGVLLEYQLPLSSKRLDCMITGRNGRSDAAVVVELKQWDGCEPCEGDNEVITWLGGAKRCALHPCAQAGQYAAYLRDCHTVFHEENAVALDACSYLHNYRPREDDPLLAAKFRARLKQTPLFCATDVDAICRHLTARVGQGDGLKVLARVTSSRHRPSKKLLDHVSSMIRREPAYVLLDEQLVSFDRVLAAAERGLRDARKRVILIQGGPGSGKSVVALNLIAALSAKGVNTLHATGSRAFTGTLWKILGTRSQAQFKYFNSFATATENEIDVLVLDEAHRIRKSSVSRFTPAAARSGLPQVDELIKAAKVAVFFIDDLQGIKPDEVGSAALIREAASRSGCSLEEHRLEAQFRCAGSDGFVNWIDNTLGLRKTANTLWQGDPRFDFRILGSPEQVEAEIRKRVAEGATGRMTAGFCWPWSKRLDQDGQLIRDVRLGRYERAWNARPEMTRLPPGVPKSTVWAYDPRGLDQVGCIYTAQGFEFDYAGVIFGKDLVYDWEAGDWSGRPESSHDNQVRRGRAAFLEHVKRTYRVLLSRGMKGCFVYFEDPGTRRFFESRMERGARDSDAKEVPAALEVIARIPEAARWKTHLPVYSLEAAAGGFSGEQWPREHGWIEAAIGRQLAKDMFVCRVKGRSMEPLIRDGAWCVFRADRGGSREGKVVLVESVRVRDPETSARYTVKRYHSEKELFDDGTWRHKRITLKPVNSEFEDIVIEDADPAELRVAAEFVCELQATSRAQEA